MKRFLLVLALAFAPLVHASFAVGDSRFGPGTLVYEPYNHLSWLHLSATRGMTHHDVLAQTGAGQAFEGFRLLGDHEFVRLMEGLGVPHEFSRVAATPAAIAAATSFAALVGGSRAIEGGPFMGRFRVTQFRFFNGDVRYDNDTDLAVLPPDMGVWVVAPPIPEPSTWALLAAGLLGVGWQMRRRQLR